MVGRDFLFRWCVCLTLEKRTHPRAVGADNWIQTISVVHGWSFPLLLRPGLSSAMRLQPSLGRTHRINRKSVKLRVFVVLSSQLPGAGLEPAAPDPPRPSARGRPPLPPGRRRMRPLRPGRGGMGPARLWGTAAVRDPGAPCGLCAGPGSPWSRGSSASTLWRLCASPARASWATAAAGRRTRWGLAPGAGPARWDTPSARLGDTQGLKYPRAGPGGVRERG